jgi:hypothetical protein
MVKQFVVEVISYKLETSKPKLFDSQPLTPNSFYQLKTEILI